MTPSYNTIISDFDGTLVKNSVVLSDRLTTAIQTLLAKGWHFSIATGRMRTPEFENIINALGLKDPIVFNGGAEIFNPVTGEVILRHTMSLSLVQEILNACSSREVTPFIYQDGYMYIDNPLILRSPERYSLKPLSDLTAQEIEKIRISFPMGKQREMMTFLEELSRNFTTLSINRSDTPISLGCDITSLLATKHQAALQISEILGVSPQQIIGIGDGYNDYPLLTACGYKVAIETAPPELKEIADHIIPSQESEGVATYFESLIS